MNTKPDFPRFILAFLVIYIVSRIIVRVISLLIDRIISICKKRKIFRNIALLKSLLILLVSLCISLTYEICSKLFLLITQIK